MHQFLRFLAPLPGTFISFWRMVWQTNSPLVVMLGKESESGVVSYLTNISYPLQTKMDRYWPFYTSSPEVYGHITVTLLSEEMDPKTDITSRSFQLSNDEVIHYR